MIKKITLAIFALFTLVLQANAQQTSNIKVSFDIESAKAVCKVLALKKADTLQLQQISKLYGNTLLIKKVEGYSGAGEDVFKKTLREIIETGTIKNDDPYNWKLVKANLPAIQKLLSYLTTNQEKFMKEVQAIISNYTPTTLTATTKACFLVGGGSLGFTIGDDPTFNVALQKIGDDVEGLKYLVAHELYHNIQDAGQQTRKKSTTEKPPYFIKASYALLYNLWAEGTANYVGDFEKIKNPKPFSLEQQVAFKKNNEHQYSNFYLFETLIYRQYTDTTARYQPLYDIAYSTAFDEVGYYVGYEMAKKISQYNGNSAIAALVTQDPMFLIQTYIALYKSHPEDKSFRRFSSSVEAIIDKVLVWKDKI